MEDAQNFLLSSGDNEAFSKKIEKSLKFFAISRGDSKAMVFLGLYLDKMGQSKELGQWIEKAKAADLKDNDGYAAHALLGEIYLEGLLQKQNIKEGLELLNIAASAGNPGAHNLLGGWYRDKGDLQKAEEHYRRAARLGKTEAYSKLAKIEITRGNIPEAISLLEEAALWDDTNAIRMLIEGYDKNGWAGSPDPDKSAYWFKQLLESYPCEVKDLLFIARSYMEGAYGLPVDEQESGKWLDRLTGVEMDNAEDKQVVASAVLNSALVNDPARREMALKILQESAETGDAAAIKTLGEIYLKPDFPGYDTKKALLWLTKGAEAGDQQAMLSLSSLYMAGHGVEASTKQGEFWLQKAAEAGNPEAIKRVKAMKNARP
ncbi:MAG: SEL1-like repeat protein [Alphaproteobacteria bacterium]|nr:SEL1-like repeat protein [Alphaproteobacteria bacterium]